MTEKLFHWSTAYQCLPVGPVAHIESVSNCTQNRIRHRRFAVNLLFGLVRRLCVFVRDFDSLICSGSLSLANNAY